MVFLLKKQENTERKEIYYDKFIQLERNWLNNAANYLKKNVKPQPTNNKYKLLSRSVFVKIRIKRSNQQLTPRISISRLLRL